MCVKHSTHDNTSSMMGDEGTVLRWGTLAGATRLALLWAVAVRDRARPHDRRVTCLAAARPRRKRMHTPSIAVTPPLQASARCPTQRTLRNKVPKDGRFPLSTRTTDCVSRSTPSRPRPRVEHTPRSLPSKRPRWPTSLRPSCSSSRGLVSSGRLQLGVEEQQSRAEGQCQSAGEVSLGRDCISMGRRNEPLPRIMGAIVLVYEP